MAWPARRTAAAASCWRRRASSRGPIPPRYDDLAMGAGMSGVPGVGRSAGLLARQLRAAALVGGLVAVAGGGAYTLATVGHAALDVAGTIGHVAGRLGLDLPAPLTHVTVPGSPTSSSSAGHSPGTTSAGTSAAAKTVQPIVLAALAVPAPSPQPLAAHRASTAPRAGSAPSTHTSRPHPVISSQPPVGTGPSIPPRVSPGPTPTPTKGGGKGHGPGGGKGHGPGGGKGHGPGGGKGHGPGGGKGHGPGNGGGNGGHIITVHPPHLPTPRLPLGPTRNFGVRPPSWGLTGMPPWVRHLLGSTHHAVTKASSASAPFRLRITDRATSDATRG